MVPVPWRQLWPLLGLAGRRPLWLQLGLAAAQVLLPIAGLLAMQWLIDAVALGLAGRLDAATASADATRAILLATAVAFAGGVLRSVYAVLTEHHGRALGDAAAAAVQQHATQLDLAAFDRPAFHDLLQRASTEAGSRPVRLGQDGIALLVAGLSLLVMATLLGSVAPWLPLLVAGASLPLAWQRAAHARLRFQWQQEHTPTQRDIGYLGAVLTGRATAKDVRALALAGPLGGRLERLRHGLRTSLMALARRRSRDELLVQMLASAGLFVAYWVLVRQALAGGIGLGALVLHAQVAQRTQNAVRDLLAARAAVGEHRLFLRPLVEFLQLAPHLVPAPPPGLALPPGPLAIAVDGLDFAYPEQPRPALQTVTFAIAAGERIAIVGKNGSGKSTLLKLLLRLYDPQQGEIRIGDRPLPTLEPRAFRAGCAVLLQDAALFELSVRDNLQLGRASAPAAATADAAAWSALAAVGLEARVRALPYGLDTICSRRHPQGVDWSPGEARRLLLARALQHAGGLLVLDEPFAALDGDAAAAVAAQLLARPRTQTMLIVDHRPEAVTVADRVLVFDGGRLVANGTPTALAAHEAAFRRLFPDLAR
ncbi:MAG: ABC transporter ATP-binding protein/permease [Planctomycetes bacterium]|nr:ABC transporter ATP-binding protein/permease [Planctomycetota bacterium]